VATNMTEKKIDLPPAGDRNADPITGAPGSHPIETGIGAAAAGAAAGMAVGAFTGPVGAAVGAAVGAVAGGYAGKGVGEMIDPTVDDTLLRDNFDSRPYVEEGDNFEDYEPAYRYGGAVESKFGDANFERMEPEIRSEWDKLGDTADYPWADARPAVKDGYDRTVELRKLRNKP
jgi:Glycine zipper